MLVAVIMSFAQVASASQRCHTNEYSRQRDELPIYNVRVSGISCKAAGATVLGTRGPNLKSRLGESVPVWDGIIAGMDEWYPPHVVVVSNPLNPEPRVPHSEYVEPPLQHWICRARSFYANEGPGYRHQLVAQKLTCKREHATVTGELSE